MKNRIFNHANGSSYESEMCIAVFNGNISERNNLKHSQVFHQNQHLQWEICDCRAGVHWYIPGQKQSQHQGLLISAQLIFSRLQDFYH